MDYREIVRTLPHRYPFLLIDRVVEFEAGKRIVAIKNVTANEPFFSGHFPGHPVMPGVLILEALAQTGAVLALKMIGTLEGRMVYLAGIDGARFRRAVVPGDQLRLTMELVQARSRSCRMAGRAEVDGQLAAQAEILSALVDPVAP